MRPLIMLDFVTRGRCLGYLGACSGESTYPQAVNRVEEAIGNERKPRPPPSLFPSIHAMTPSPWVSPDLQ